MLKQYLQMTYFASDVGEVLCTHSLHTLVRKAGIAELKRFSVELSRLSDYYLYGRYPSVDYEEATEADVEELVPVVREVWDVVMAEIEAVGVPRELPPIFKNKLLEVAEVLVENADQLKMQELWLFGSAARGDFTATSDLDLLVLTTSEREREISLKVEALEVRDDVGYPNVDVIVRNLRSLGDESYAVFNNAVKRDKIVLWERGEPSV